MIPNQSVYRTIFHTALVLCMNSLPAWAAPNEGALVGWGNNGSGQTTVPAGNNFMAIAAGYTHSLALKSDGSLVSWGDNSFGQTNVPAGNDFVAIAAGDFESLALKSDGSLAAWGNNGSGQTTVPSGNDFVAIAAGFFHCLALKSDGSLTAWGDNSYGQLYVPADNDFVAIAAGDNHSLALKSDGSLAGWGGHNGSGETTMPAGNDFVAIAAGGSHNFALKSDGSLAGWGSNYDGQSNAPTGNDYVAISAGGAHSLALKSDGSLAGWGNNSLAQATVPVGNDFVVIATGVLHSLAIQQIVPEPASIALLAIGLPLLLVRNSRRSRACRLHGGRRFVLAAASAALLLNVAGVARADWLIKSYASPNAIVNYAAADALIAGVGLAPGFPVSSQYPLTHVQDNDSEFTDLGLGQQIVGLPGAPSDWDNFAFVGQGTLTVDVTGEYTFGTATDDGSRLRININGGPTQQIITDDVLSAMHIVRSAPLTLSAGDTVAFDWMWFERRGGAEGVLFYSRDPFDAVIGDSSLGLSLSGGNFTGTVYDAQYQAIRSFSDADAVKNTPGSERGSALRNVFNINDGGLDATDGLFDEGEPSPGIPPFPPFTEDSMTQGTGWLVVQPDQAGQYLFHSHSDDGGRLRIDLNDDGDFDDDGELAIFDDVNEPPHGANSGLVALAAGRYPIEYSFFNGIYGGEGEISAALIGGGPEQFFLLGDEASGGLDIVQVPESATCFYLLATLLILAPFRHRTM